MQLTIGQALEQVAKACRGYLCNADERILLDQCFKVVAEYAQKGAKFEIEMKKQAELKAKNEEANKLKAVEPSPAP